ncbi:YagK/YfjJ domain-containing protein [Alkalimarinus sediminis]|uniref:Inovirus Gp2 family protein n=1 Tax=Alkalimarinus sediminis TaxID=1632866 RepID=A0A9E8KPJ3_9ALTE|nr:inovirus-type Gp2 protein [Alkalimarinus sediminis]UZW74240.1 inovirus Gp2 family protein [Alkalimarinus sediminis]
MYKPFDQQHLSNPNNLDSDIPKRRLKRLRENPNLSYHYAPYYKGLPVQVSRGPLVAEWLENIRSSMLEQVATHSKIFALRIDLRLPGFYSLPEGQIFGNDYYDRFKRRLKRLLDDMPDTRNHGLKLVAAREYDQYENKPHFHVLVLLNGNAIRATGKWDLSCDNLYSRLHDAWAHALGLNDHEVLGLIQFSDGAKYCSGSRSQAKGGAFLMERGDHNMFEDVFFACSYLAKYATKNFNDGCHPFLCSRVKLTDW